MKRKAVSAPKTAKTVVEMLREAADKNPVFAAICKIWTNRERARKSVILVTLKNTMLKEGMKYSDQELGNALKVLEELGLGKTILNPDGSVRGVTDITMQLQSIGLAALKKKGSLSEFKQANRFEKLDEHLAEPLEKVLARAPKVAGGEYVAKIIIPLGDREIELPLPDMSLKALVKLIQDAKE